GDFNYAGYGAMTESWPALVTNRNLDQFVRDYTPTLALLERIRMADFRAGLNVILNWARALQGLTSGALSLSDEHFDEQAFVSTYEKAAPSFLTFSYTARLHLSVLFEEFTGALAAARKARAVAVTGTMWPVLIDFWGGLAMAALYDDATAAQRQSFRHELANA